MAFSAAREPADYCLVARRNHSLSPAGRQFVLVSLLVVSLAISLAFAALGAWLVLPFSGLELAVVYWAFREMDRHAQDFERIVIDGDHLVIEACEGGTMHRYEFNRWWAQVRYIPARLGQRASIIVRAHGNEVIFGRHLPEERLREVAQRIGQRIRNQ